MKIWPVVSTGLAVFFLVMWLTNSCDKPTTPPEDATLWREQVKAREAVIREKDSIISAISIQRDIDTREHLRASTALQMRESALVRKLKEANADIKVIADSLPKVARYVELADSTIAVKDSLYHQEVEHRMGMEKLYQVEVATLGERNVVQKQISTLLETKVTSLEKQNSKLAKRLERKTKFNRLLLGIAAGLGAAIAVITLSQ